MQGVPRLAAIEALRSAARGIARGEDEGVQARRRCLREDAVHGTELLLARGSPGRFSADLHARETIITEGHVNFDL